MVIVPRLAQGRFLAALLATALLVGMMMAPRVANAAARPYESVGEWVEDYAASHLTAYAVAQGTYASSASREKTWFAFNSWVDPGAMVRAGFAYAITQMAYDATVIAPRIGATVREQFGF